MKEACHQFFCVIFPPQHHHDGSRGQLKGLGFGRDAAWADR